MLLGSFLFLHFCGLVNMKFELGKETAKEDEQTAIVKLVILLREICYYITENYLQNDQILGVEIQLIINGRKINICYSHRIKNATGRFEKCLRILFIMKYGISLMESAYLKIEFDIVLLVKMLECHL